MEINDYAQYLDKVKQNLLPIGLGLVGLILLGYGLIYSINSEEASSSENDVTFESSKEEVSEADLEKALQDITE